jgi:hypothetical protein
LELYSHDGTENLKPKEGDEVEDNLNEVDKFEVEPPFLVNGKFL